MCASFNLFDIPKKQKRKKNLMEFRAGKMKLDNNNWVHPDKRKGLVFIHQSNDGLMHFCWKDRISGKVEDDLVVFPDETIFKRLPECNTGRVYLLKFKNSKKLFLWMQEPKEDNDAELCKKVNEILNNKSIDNLPLGAKTVNMNELTELLGELNEIGALNDIDLLELLAQGFGTQSSNESDLIAVTQTTPFQIGGNASAPTDAEQHNNVPPAPTNQLTQLGISSLYSQTTKDSNFSSTTDVSTIFSDNTIDKLSKNQVFRRKFLFIENETISETSESNLAKDSIEYKKAMKDFCEILSNYKAASELLQEMGLPDTILSELSAYDLINVLQALEQYFATQNRKEN